MRRPSPRALAGDCAVTDPRATDHQRPERILMPNARLGALALTVLLTSPVAAADVRVFVTNEKSNDVTVIDAATRTVVKTLPVGQRPRGVTVSPDGRRVYVSNSNSDSVSV